VLWAAAITLRLADLMILNRHRYLLEMGQESWREGTIPPLRGRILDRDGTPLAWSTRHFALRYLVSDSPEAIRSDLDALGRVRPQLNTPAPASLLRHSKTEVILNQNLTPADIAALAPLTQTNSAFRMNSYFTRHYNHSDANLRQRVGKIRTVKGMQIGIFGEEKRHDHLLRGCPGKFRIMVDKNGKWLPKTWQQIRDLRPGYDVYLPIRLQSTKEHDS
jgi:cell division protein FtsI/penicillin-binding protein 2